MTFSLTRNKIYTEIEAIVEAAEAKYGNGDEGHSTNDWLAFVNAYLGRAATGVYRNTDDSREMVLKAAGLLVRALEVKIK